MNFTRRQFNTGLAALGTATALGGGIARAADPLKVGFIYVGPVGDFGWSYRHDQGRKAVEAKYGDKVKTTFVESVPEGADAERVITQLAQTGHGLIFTTSFGFMNPTLKVAKRFPNVKFEHATGYKRAPNLSTYAARFYEGRHLVGVIASQVTKSNIIGYIGSHPIPEVIRGINSFTIAARRINPKIEVRPVWVNSWYDPGKEADAAKALIDQGADVMLQHTDSPAAMQVAQERGIFAVGQASDMRKFGPDAQLTAIVDDWDPYYIARVGAVMDGTWKSEDTWGGLKEGMVMMAEYNPKIPEAVIKQVNEHKDSIIAGKLHPFQGPVNKQDGSKLLGEGETLADKDLLSMNYYVEGVVGDIPS